MIYVRDFVELALYHPHWVTTEANAAEADYVTSPA